VVADTRFLDYRDNTHTHTHTKTNILTKMNRAADIFHDVSVGNPLYIVLMYIIYPHKQEGELYLHISQYTDASLEFLHMAGDGEPPR
jgi:hypothetical protein